MELLARSRGGHYLSREYVNVEQPLTWSCRAGHRWRATPASVRSGKWCASCARNRRLEIQELQRLARERGGKCLSAKYVNNREPLVWECQRGHRWKASASNVKGGERKKGTWCPDCYELRRRFRERDSIESMRELSKSRGGVCLSDEYVNAKSKPLWRCDRGHCWRAVPHSIQRGSWCPACARNQRLRLEEFRWLAASRGGSCLSDHYINKDTPLKWRCAVGHYWYAGPGKVKLGAWCAKCAYLRRRSPWKRSSGRSSPRPSQCV